jgi:hypothetical protein
MSSGILRHLVWLKLTDVPHVTSETSVNFHQTHGKDPRDIQSCLLGCTAV